MKSGTNGKLRESLKGFRESTKVFRESSSNSSNRGFRCFFRKNFNNLWELFTTLQNRFKTILEKSLESLSFENSRWKYSYLCVWVQKDGITLKESTITHILWNKTWIERGSLDPYWYVSGKVGAGIKIRLFKNGIIRNQSIWTYEVNLLFTVSLICELRNQSF